MPQIATGGDTEVREAMARSVLATLGRMDIEGLRAYVPG
jgi:hypothetical protein